MARSPQRHIQQELASYTELLDKHQQPRGTRKAEHRRKVGRPRAKWRTRSSERHKTRLAFRASQPVHVIVRTHADVGTLRRRALIHAIRDAVITAAKWDDFHIIQMSVQRNHIHLICEAGGRRSLSRGMQSFGIAAAKRINGMIFDLDGKPRRGTVFPDRYHVRILSTPTQVRNCLHYVLNNWRRHGEDRARHTKHWHLDPFSSAIRFHGWREAELNGGSYIQPPTYVAPAVWAPSTWLLTTGWRKAGGLISAFDRPGPGQE